MRPIIEPPFCKFLRWIVGVVYPNMELVGLENLPEDAFVLVGNHSEEGVIWLYYAQEGLDADDAAERAGHCGRGASAL